MSDKPTEKRYQLSVTLGQLSILKTDMDAVAEPAHRNAAELELIELIDQTHKRAFKAEKLHKARATVHATEVLVSKSPDFYDRFICDDPK